MGRVDHGKCQRSQRRKLKAILKPRKKKMHNKTNGWNQECVFVGNWSNEKGFIHREAKGRLALTPKQRRTRSQWAKSDPHGFE